MSPVSSFNNATQINLVVGDYFKSQQQSLEHMDSATNLIAWLRSKTLLLAILQKAQMDATGSAKAVIRAVITRWTSHYMAIKRLLELKPSLMSVVYADEARSTPDKLIVIGDAKAKRKAHAMIGIIKNPLFWYSLARSVFTVLVSCVQGF